MTRATQNCQKPSKTKIKSKILPQPRGAYEDIITKCNISWMASQNREKTLEEKNNNLRICE